MLDIETPHGLARIHLQPADEPRAALVLGHGAGGGVGAPDLVAASGAARAAGVSVALVEQPYRVAGRRSPAPAAQLDAAWIAVVEQLRARRARRAPLCCPGAGPRALALPAAPPRRPAVVGVLCLAFPLRPPGRESAPSRLPELDAVTVPVLVVQGERDPFGIPPASKLRSVVLVPGNHSLRSAQPVTDAVANWLSRLI